MSTISYSTAAHEARHVIASWALDPGLRVDSVRVGIHAIEEGQMDGTRISGRPGIGDLVTRLCGWLGDDDLPPGAQLPPAWPVPAAAADGVGIVVKRLGLTQRQYEGACRIAESLVRERVFEEAVELLARAIQLAPQVDHEALELLRAETAFADEPGAEEITCPS